MNESVPMLKKRTLDDRMTIPVERELKQRFQQIKTKKGVDVLEYIRRVLRNAASDLEKIVV